MHRSPSVARDCADAFEVVATRDTLGVHVAIRGELDLATAPELDRVLVNLEAHGVERIVIDLVGVEFIGSTGLASIVRAQRAADRHGHRLVIRRGSRQAQRLFELAGLLGWITFEN
jgi:anti-anti-sigma factor